MKKRRLLMMLNTLNPLLADSFITTMPNIAKD